MAISHTMSNPNNWPFQPYDHDHQNNISNINNQNDQFSSTNNIEGSSSTSMLRNNNNNNLSPDQGRVSKPVRRRSRASRRTPTTVLSTDTTNFRAMVQQFTGSPTTPFMTVQQPQPILYAGATNNLNFIRDFSTMNAPASTGFHVQYPNQDNMPYMIDHNNITHGGGGGGGGVRGRSGGEGGAFTSGFPSDNKDD